MSAFNCCCQLINFNCPQLATECSGKYEQQEPEGKPGLLLFYAKPSLAFKQIFPRSEVVCIFFLMWPENSIRNDIFCPYSTQTKTVRLNWRRGPGTQNAAHLARAKGIFPSGNRTAQVLTLPPPLSHRHHHKSHTCCSHVLDETNALSRNFIHKDFISFRFHPDSKRPQGVGLDQQK